MRILAIETSCDETAAAIVENLGEKIILRSNVVSSQINIHSASGGVIPDVAARLHTENLPVVLKEATLDDQLTYDALAITVGPGLIGSLLIGLSCAKTIALTKNLPFFAINHLEGHIYSSYLGEKKPELPALFLIVSGGHTEMIYMAKHLKYQLLGSTRDDAAGEAFDKVARLLGLGYPGGPAIAHMAIRGNENAFDFPIGLREKDNLEFSFSGLKAAVVHTTQGLRQPLSQQIKADIAASFQKTVILTLARKVTAALEKYPELKTFCLVGGVAANLKLRTYLKHMINNDHPDINFIVPELQFCTDNAAMIGAAAIHHHLYGRTDNWQLIQADPGLELKDKI